MQLRLGCSAVAFRLQSSSNLNKKCYTKWFNFIKGKYDLKILLVLNNSRQFFSKRNSISALLNQKILTVKTSSKSDPKPFSDNTLLTLKRGQIANTLEIKLHKIIFKCKIIKLRLILSQLQTAKQYK